MAQEEVKKSFDWDYLYYIFCVKLGRSDEEFWDSYMCKIFALIDLYIQEQEQKAQAIQNSTDTTDMEDIV